MADRPATSKAPVNEIRIIKRGKGHAGHHGGAWKVAYADFVTAMMAFFLVMWICGLSTAIKEAVAGYFRDPVAFMDNVRSGKSPFATPNVENTAGGKMLQNQGAVVDRTGLDKAKKNIEKMIAQSAEFKKLAGSVEIKMVPEGLEIDLIDGKENLFFDAGSANVKPEAAHLLSAVAQQLGKIANKVIIEGHTDCRPLGTSPRYTNWELSADRANAARSIMQGGGLGLNQIDQVRGYAATRPRNKDPYHYSNRRVSIIVVMNTEGAGSKSFVGSDSDAQKLSNQLENVTGHTGPDQNNAVNRPAESLKPVDIQKPVQPAKPAVTRPVPHEDIRPLGGQIFDIKIKSDKK